MSFATIHEVFQKEVGKMRLRSCVKKFSLVMVLSTLTLTSGCGSKSKSGADGFGSGVTQNWTPKMTAPDLHSMDLIPGYQVFFPSGYQDNGFYKDANYQKQGIGLVSFVAMDHSHCWFDYNLYSGYDVDPLAPLKFLEHLHQGAYENWRTTQAEKGLINGHPCIREYWSGDHGGTKRHGIIYVAEFTVQGRKYVLSSVSQDVEPYSSKTIPLVEAAVFASIHQ